MAAPKILIVDDEPDILTVLAQRLAPCGYEIVTALDGEEAVAKVGSWKPDLIIMDVLMPNMTGYEALQKMRENADLRKIPVIMISARGAMKNYFVDLSRVEFISKPYDVQELLAKVRRLLESVGVKVLAPGSEQRRSVVVLGVQEGLVANIQSMILSMGIEAERALNEEDACKVAQRIFPEKIFCQFWEDEKIYSPQKLFSRFSKTPAFSRISFYVFCENKTVLEAMKVFSEDKIIIYRESSDLLAKISKILKVTA